MRAILLFVVAAVVARRVAAQPQQPPIQRIRPVAPLAQVVPPNLVVPGPAPLPRPLVPQRIIGQPYRLPTGQIYSPDHFYNRGPDGYSFNSGYTSPDGTQVFMQGDLVPTLDGQDQVVVKRGGYSYVSPEGNQIVVRYIADHQGFRVIPNDGRAQ